MVSKKKKAKKSVRKPVANAESKVQVTEASDLQEGHLTAHSSSIVDMLPLEELNPMGTDQRKVLVLYSGGTMGMQDNGSGSLGPSPGALVKQLRQVKELNNPKMPRCYVLEFKTLLDSADMTSEDWNSIASVVANNYYHYDGFVVIHGTDTLGYTASALSFMLEQLAKPVVVTGSQLPFFAPLSDARQNFLGAVVFAGLADISEVCVFFCGQLLRGNRTRKGDATSLTAFHSPNYAHLADVGVNISVHRSRLQEPPRGRFRYYPIRTTEIVMVCVFPGFSDAFLGPIVQSGTVRGMVLLLYGCGNAPARQESFLSKLRQLVQSGVVVVACSQCTKGTVDLHKYAVGKAFQDCGIVGAEDMTPEATVTKMAYLLSKDLTADQVRKAMAQNLRGEMSLGSSFLKIGEPITGLGTGMVL